jgi:ribosomal protein S1
LKVVPRNIAVGTVMTGKVLWSSGAGANVQLLDSLDIPSVQAWLPTHQISQQEVKSAQEVFHAGDEVTAVILSIKPAEVGPHPRIYLGIKQLEVQPGDMLIDRAAVAVGAEERAAQWLQDRSASMLQQRKQQEQERQEQQEQEWQEWQDQQKQLQQVQKAARKLELQEQQEAARKEEEKAAAEEALSRLQQGDVVTGIVEGIKEFGAFVRLTEGALSLLPRSQISKRRVAAVDKVLKPGDVVVAVYWPGKKEAPGRISLNTRCLERTPGDMLRDPSLVYETAEEVAAELRATLQAKAEAQAAKAFEAEFRSWGMEGEW